MAKRYVGPGGSKLFGSRWRWPGAPKKLSIVGSGLNGSGFGTPTATPQEVAAASAPGSPQSAGAPAPAGPPQDPSAATPAPIGDAEYFADRARREFEANQKRASLDQAQAYDTQDLHEQLRRMAMAQPQDEQAAREAANRQGLLFSGYLGKNLGDIRSSYVQRQSDNQLAYDRRQVSRDAARAAIDQGMPIDDAVALAAAADRQVARDQSAADAGYLAPDSPDPAPDATGPAQTVKSGRAVGTTGFNKKRGARFTVIKRGGVIFHRYAGGRDVRAG